MANNPVRITKKELAIRLKITSQTLAKMLNEYYFDLLKPTNYKKRQKFLLRHQLDLIFPAGIDFETK